MSYLRVCEDVGGTPIELPSEDDDTLPVTTLQAQFPNAIGLKYLPDPKTNIFRGVRCTEGRLKPPKEGWEGPTFYCVYPPDFKRKPDDVYDNNSAPPHKRYRGDKVIKCADLIVLGLNFSTTNDTLKTYFEEKFGPLLMALVKVDMNTKRSKGFGFIRFSKYEDQVKALSARKHEIDGRWVTLKPPFAKEGCESALPSKVFISRLSATMTREDIEEYFSKYGEIADTFLPRPFRGFAFVTYVSPDAADQACDEEPHIVNGVSVSVVHASEQQKKDKYGGGYNRGNNYYNNYQNSGSSERSSYGSSSRYGRSGGYKSYSRDNFNEYGGPREDYGQRDDYYGGGGGGGGGGGNQNDLTKAIAAALNNPATINTLLSNLNTKGGPGNEGGGGGGGSEYNRDYQPNSQYKDYSYSKDRKYNPYPSDENYGSGGGGGGGKYGGGSGGGLRY